MGIEDKRLERRRGRTFGRRDPGHDRLQDLLDAHSVAGRDEEAVLTGQADELLDLLSHDLGLGRGQVDLVDDGHDLEVVVDRLVDVGQGLRLHALGGINHQDRPFARGQRARNLVGEVDVARGVDEVQLVVVAVGRGVAEAHRGQFYGDATFALEVQLVQQLRLHFAWVDSPGDLQDPVRQGGFPMIDMGDDAEVPYSVGGPRHVGLILPAGAIGAALARRNRVLVPESGRWQPPGKARPPSSWRAAE